MPAHRVSASAEVKTPAEEIYAIIADYRHGHPQIVPRPPFGSLEVEQGGFGAGTVILHNLASLAEERSSLGVERLSSQ